MPDGETGDRLGWVQYQWQRFADVPTLEWKRPAGEDYAGLPELGLIDGASAADVQWPDLGYANEYTGSYATFRRLQDEGVVGPDIRFQAQYPTPLAVMSVMSPAQQGELAASYEPALFADVARLLADVPHDRVAVQWDVAVEFGVLTGGFPGGPGFDDVVAALARCVDEIPDDVPTGMHLCYGDYEHHHFAEPESIELQVRILNAVAAAARRRIDWASFTVPQDRADDEYFAALRDLKPDAGAELYFALVPYHPDTQPDGTRERQVAAVGAQLGGTRAWGVCTECGMGRVDPADVPRLLDIYAELIG